LLVVFGFELAVSFPRTIFVELIDFVVDSGERGTLFPQANVVLEVSQDRFRIGESLIELRDLRLKTSDPLLHFGD